MTKLKSRLFLLFLATVCALPLVMSYVAYYYWKPERRMNYGELLPTTQMPAQPLMLLDGTRLSASALEGKWVLVHFDKGACAADCARRLYAMRQSRLAMGVKKDKLAMLWVVEDGVWPAETLRREYQDTQFVRADVNYRSAFPPPASARIFLIDPKGNLVLRYPENPEPARMIRDLARLLDVKRM